MHVTLRPVLGMSAFVRPIRGFEGVLGAVRERVWRARRVDAAVSGGNAESAEYSGGDGGFGGGNSDGRRRDERDKRAGCLLRAPVVQRAGESGYSGGGLH